MSDKDPQATIAILRAENTRLNADNYRLRAYIETLERNSVDDGERIARLEKKLRDRRDETHGTSSFESHEVTTTSYTCMRCGNVFYTQKANGFGLDSSPRYCPCCGVRMVRDE